MARLQDFQTVTPTDSDNLLVVQATGQGLAPVGSTIGNKALKSDLASPSITGTTNNTGSTITAGTFFYLNGVVCRAKEDIGSGATLTSTNYESISSGITNEFAGYEIRTVNISDTSPINIASKTGYKVTLSNFVSACGIGCIAIPYYHTTYNSIYVGLFDYNLNPITTSKEVKIWYRGKA